MTLKQRLAEKIKTYFHGQGPIGSHSYTPEEILKIYPFAKYKYTYKMYNEINSLSKIHGKQFYDGLFSDLKKYGQWPWPRHIMAMLHARIGDAGAVMINYNILFAEPDRMGSNQYLKSFPMTKETRELLQKSLVDTDRVFAEVIKSSGNTILLMSVKNEKDNILPTVTQIIKKGNVVPWLWNYAGIFLSFKAHANFHAGLAENDGDNRGHCSRSFCPHVFTTPL